MLDIFQQDISDPNSSPNMQQQEAATHTHLHYKKGNEVTDTDPTSPSLKVKDERVDEVPPSSTMEKVTRTDPAPSLLTKDVQAKRVRGGHEYGPVPFPLPNVASSKETDGNPTLHNLPLQESTYHRRGR
ncbi:hypothetical protein P9112_014541 [Eukaryota sp. TZLM1-RC]